MEPLTDIEKAHRVISLMPAHAEWVKSRGVQPKGVKVLVVWLRNKLGFGPLPH